MIFVSVGLPSRFAEWCDSIVATLVQAALGPPALVSGATFEEIALAALRTTERHLVVGVRQPDDAFRSLLGEWGRRVVVALDDPRAAVQNLTLRHGLDWKSALRAAAGSCAALIGTIAIPEALVLRADDHFRDTVATAQAMAAWLDLPSDAGAIAGLVSAYEDPGAAAADDLDSWWNTLAQQQRSAIDGALNAYQEYFREGRLGQIVWTRELFFVGDDPQTAADHVIDIAGPVRYLLFGPYIALPPGEWDAKVVIAVSSKAAELPYTVEILAGAQFACLAQGTIQPQREGLCEAHLRFAIDGSTGQPIELRLANLQPAAGRLALVHVTLSPIAQRSADLPTEISRALGL